MSDNVTVIERGEARWIKDNTNGRFLPGTKGGGRKPGSRAKLAESFVSDLLEVWDEHGITAIERTAVTEPARFVQIVASLMPKEHKIEQTAVELTDEQLIDRLRKLADKLRRGSGANQVSDQRAGSGKQARGEEQAEQI